MARKFWQGVRCHMGIAGICLAAALSIVAGSGRAAESAEPYVIGAVLDITGSASPLGAPEEASAKLMVKQINAKGGINGHLIKLIVYDNSSDESKSVMAVKKLVDSDKVLAIIGPSQTGTTLAAAETIQSAKIPMISCAAGIGIVQPVKDWIFKTAQSDVHAAAKVLEYLKSIKVKKVAIISVANAFGDSGKEQLKTQSAKMGITVVVEESFGDKDTDMTAQLMRIRRSEAKAVICWGTNPGPAVVAKNMQTLGMDLPLIMSHGVANQKFIELAGSAANGVVLPAGKLMVVDEIAASDPQRKALVSFASEFKKEYGRDADTFGGYAHDAIGLLVQAIKKAGPDRDGIRQELQRMDEYVGVSGVFSFSPSDHNGLTKDAFAMVRIEDGQWRLIK